MTSSKVKRENRSTYPNHGRLRLCPGHDLSPLLAFWTVQTWRTLAWFPWSWTQVSKASAVATKRGACKGHQGQRQFLPVPPFPWGLALPVPALHPDHYPVAFCPGDFVSQLNHHTNNFLTSSVEQPKSARVNTPWGHPWLSPPPICHQILLSKHSLETQQLHTASLKMPRRQGVNLLPSCGSSERQLHWFSSSLSVTPASLEFHSPAKC